MKRPHTTLPFKFGAFFLILFIYAMLISCNNKNASKQQIALQKIDSLFNNRYAVNGDTSKINDFPGGAVLIMKGDSIIFDKGYGIANYETKSSIDGNTFFNIASVSKQFTATAILKLQDQGKLSIEDSLPKYFPEFKSDIWGKIKIKHLMSHTSGIPDERPRDDRNFVLTATDMESIQYMKDLDHLHFEPGTEYEYINPTFQLLYAIIEKVSGMSFEQYMKDNIFTPADMNITLYFAADREIPNMAHGYILNNKNSSSDSDLPASATASKESAKSEAMKKSLGPNNPFIEYDYGEETFFATKADGGIYTYTHEFAKWEKALRDNKIISESAKLSAHTPKIKISGSKYSTYQNRPFTSYGYGWFIDQTPDMPLKIYHTGDNGGFQIYAGRFPDKQILVLIFENRNDKDRWDMVKKIDAIIKAANWFDDTDNSK